MNINFDPSKQLPRQEKGPLAQLLTLILGVVALVGAFMFSLVFFAVLAVLVLVFGLYFWWKTRAVRQQLREQMQAQREAQRAAQSNRTSADGAGAFQRTPDGSRPARNVPAGGDVIEGQAVRLDE